MTRLHRNARTTPAIRAAIAASNEPAAVLAARYGVTEQTIYKWKKRREFTDRPHTAHRLQTTLTPVQEAVVAELRKTLLLPLDDLLLLIREFLCPGVSRSGLDRCLRRHGLSRLNALLPPQFSEARGTRLPDEPGYLLLDVKHLPEIDSEKPPCHVFVAVDQATRWVFARVKRTSGAPSARSFLGALDRLSPIRISRIGTCNGHEFGDRLLAELMQPPAAGRALERLCEALEIDPRSAPASPPRPRGSDGRFKARLDQVLDTERFVPGLDMCHLIEHYARLYNHRLPQAALQSRTPIQAMKDWYQRDPHLFKRKPYELRSVSAVH